jgi:hypothetical protein
MGRLLAMLAGGSVPVGAMLAAGIAILVALVVAGGVLMQRRRRP